jgi:hypothetical protein
VKAAWKDVLAAFTGDGWAKSWAETCELRLLQLGELSIKIQKELT